MFDHTKLKVYFQSKYVDFDDAKVSISNTAFLYGLGIFTGMRAHYNKDEEQLYLFRPKDHYKRFYNSAKVCRFNNFLNNYDYEKFLNVIKGLLVENKIKEDTYIRVSGYIDEMSIGPKFGKYKDDFCVYLYPLGDYVPTGGMRCKVSSFRRISDNAIPARIKVNGAYVNTAFAKTEALEAGFDEAILLDDRDHAVEGSAENLYIVRDGVVITPPVTDNILEGVTRKSLLEIMKDEKIEYVERSIDRTELYFADEVFLSGTGAKVSPVVEIDNIKIGNGEIGPISKKLQDIYFDLVKGKVEKYKIWLEKIY